MASRTCSGWWVAALVGTTGCAGPGVDAEVPWSPERATLELMSNLTDLAPGDVAVVTVRLQGVPAERAGCLLQHAEDVALSATPLEAGQVELVNGRGEYDAARVPVTWTDVVEETRDGARFAHAEGTVVVQARRDGRVQLQLERRCHLAEVPLVAARPGRDVLALRIGCDPAFDVAGTYARRTTCSETSTRGAGEVCATTDRVSTVTLRRSGPDPADYAFEDRSATVVAVGQGRLCGKVLTWSAQRPGAEGRVESGIWSFPGDGTFTQPRSSYALNPGEGLGRCTGTGALGAEAPRPAPVGACP